MGGEGARGDTWCTACGSRCGTACTLAVVVPDVFDRFARVPRADELLRVRHADAVARIAARLRVAPVARDVHDLRTRLHRAARTDGVADVFGVAGLALRRGELLVVTAHARVHAHGVAVDHSGGGVYRMAVRAQRPRLQGLGVETSGAREPGSRSSPRESRNGIPRTSGWPPAPRSPPPSTLAPPPRGSVLRGRAPRWSSSPADSTSRGSTRTSRAHADRSRAAGSARCAQLRPRGTTGRSCHDR